MVRYLTLSTKFNLLNLLYMSPNFKARIKVSQLYILFLKLV